MDIITAKDIENFKNYRPEVVMYSSTPKYGRFNGNQIERVSIVGVCDFESSKLFIYVRIKTNGVNEDFEMVELSDAILFINDL